MALLPPKTRCVIDTDVLRVTAIQADEEKHTCLSRYVPMCVLSTRDGRPCLPSKFELLLFT